MLSNTVKNPVFQVCAPVFLYSHIQTYDLASVMTVCNHVKEGSSSRLRCVQRWIFWPMCCFLEGLIQWHQRSHPDLPIFHALQSFWTYKPIFHYLLSQTACQLAFLLQYVDTVMAPSGFLDWLSFPGWFSLIFHLVLVTEGILPSWVCGTIEIIE